MAMTTRTYLMAGAAVILAGIAASAAVMADQGNPAEADDQDSEFLADHEPKHDIVIVADNSSALYNAVSELSAANYESDWVDVGSGQSTNIIFYAGFRPRLVSVSVQMHGCNGSWLNLFSFVPPAHTSWDDMYTAGENVYWIRGHNIIVHHEGVIRGTNIHDGCSRQRFQVFAWR
jgi:hypothetical protein